MTAILLALPFLLIAIVLMAVLQDDHSKPDYPVKFTQNGWSDQSKTRNRRHTGRS